MSPLLPYEWIVAMRFLRDGRLQSLFIVTAASIGVAVIVFMSSMLAGLQANFIRRVLSAQPHIELLPAREVARVQRPSRSSLSIVQQPLQRPRTIDQWSSVLASLRAMDDVVHVTPIASGAVLAVRGDASRAVSLLGVEPAEFFAIVPIPDKIVAGRARLGSQDILIGTELASDLGVTVGDKLRITSAAGGDDTLTVSGIFDLGNKGANQRTTFVALRGAQSLLGLAGDVTSIQLTVRDVYAADTVAARITARTGVEADSWIATNAQFFTAVQAQTTANTAIRLFVGLSVAFGIASVLIVSVVQRSREIGILRATGTSRGQVMRVFLLQGGVLGLAGALAGSATGAAAVYAWYVLVRNADGTPLFPLSYDPRLFVLTSLIATITGVAAAVAPAFRAARLDPVVAIRG